MFVCIRDIGDALLLTSPVIRYPCMITCRVECYINLTVESNRDIPTTGMSTSAEALLKTPNKYQFGQILVPTLFLGLRINSSLILPSVAGLHHTL